MNLKSISKLYYTPGLLELVPGCELEIRKSFTDQNWVVPSTTVSDLHYLLMANDEWDIGRARTHKRTDKRIDPDYMRMKYLDKKDIESEGWTIEEEFKDGRLSFTGVFNNVGREDVVFGILYILSSKWIFISDSDNKTVFRGFCKNKSQFKQVLTWTDVRKPKQ